MAVHKKQVDAARIKQFWQREAPKHDSKHDSDGTDMACVS